jgi:hypothetical protein
MDKEQTHLLAIVPGPVNGLAGQIPPICLNYKQRLQAGGGAAGSRLLAFHGMDR